jgi:hypothetical protein
MHSISTGPVKKIINCRFCAENSMFGLMEIAIFFTKKIFLGAFHGNAMFISSGHVFCSLFRVACKQRSSD